MNWRYTDTIPESRRVALSAFADLLELVAIAADEVQIVAVSARHGCDPGLTDCIQPIFCLDLPRSGDALYSGPKGLRACYLASPFEGVEATHKLINALAPKLLAAAAQANDDDIEKINVCTSLKALSAKIWVREGSWMNEYRRDLDVPTWTSEADRGVDLARLGLLAPEDVRFEVKGALLDPFGNERVPCRKVSRHRQIHHYGYS